MAFTNEAEITKLSNTTADRDKNNDNAQKSLALVKNPELPEKAEAYLTVSAPTGGDRQSPVLYIITGTVMLAILSAGVIIIKKKVL
jgi:hypothetical protein